MLLIEQTGYTEPFNAILEWTPDSVTSTPVPLPLTAAPANPDHSIRRALAMSIRTARVVGTMTAAMVVVTVIPMTIAI